MEYKILNNINSATDLRALSNEEITLLCDEIRAFLIEKVEKNGGHLASNLGVVEMTVAMHRVFNSPEDHIVFDVGHQSYVHKILTGRRDSFDTLRTVGGLSGFTSRRESEHDAFGAGHSSTSLSAALGFAESDKLQGKDSYTVAVVGDGAYTGGMIHEAINNCKQDLKLVVILNENGMSISSNKGAFASYISRFKASKKYIKAKTNTKSILKHIPLLGPLATWIMAFLKDVVKRIVYKPSYFEDLGFYYIGPIDGNDHKKVERALRQAKSLEKCVFVHLVTTKGKGYQEAENAPEKFHSVAQMPGSGEDTFHSVFADELIKLAKEQSDVVAVTPAMGIGTGLDAFETKYGDRYFDVGIAEGHALTFAAGLAANGLKPYTAIYSTFMQRGYDSIVHDIALQSLPVKMFVDRAGLAASDGPTHHGIFDVAFMSHIPGVEIYQPTSYNAMRSLVRYAYSCTAPISVRYPNAQENASVVQHFGEDYTLPWIKLDFDLKNPPKNIFITYGQIASRVIESERKLSSAGVDCGIVLTEKIKPCNTLTDILAEISSRGTHLVFVEEGILTGGMGMQVREAMIDRNALCDVRFDIAAIDGEFANPDKPCDLYDFVGLSADKLAEYFTPRG